MKDRIYVLRNSKRFFNYPCPVSELAFFTTHKSPAFTFLKLAYFTFSFNFDKYHSGYEKGYATASLHRYGVPLKNDQFVIHDEVCIGYDRQHYDALAHILNISPEASTPFRVNFKITSDIGMICQNLREKADMLHEDGMPDTIDMLSTQLLIGSLNAGRSEAGVSTSTEYKINGIAAGLKRGEELLALLKKYALGKRTFYNLWRLKFSTSPVQYRLNENIKQAQHLLGLTDKSIAEICTLCNFNDTVYFSKKFRQHTGMSPTAFREKCRNGTGLDAIFEQKQ